ncbi:MAG TPA: hypothetical protein VI818_07075 [Candidatus Thermoplasmatota archaeon]|nr:hypothetical protein [Candidatus Thermoplasmatota archaeon]
MDDQGTSAVLGFLIGFTVFVGSFVYVIDVAVDETPDTGAADAAQMDLTARELAETIFAPGSGWYNPMTCVSSPTEPDTPDIAFFVPESVEQGRFGLGEERCEPSYSESQRRMRLSFRKIDNIYSGNETLSLDQNPGVVDYPEARASLGLDADSFGFHVRGWPVLSNVRQMLRDGQRDPNMRVLYWADYTTTDSEGNKKPSAAAYTEIRFLSSLVQNFRNASQFTTTSVNVEYGDPTPASPIVGQVEYVAPAAVGQKPNGDIFPADKQAQTTNGQTIEEVLESALKAGGSSYTLSWYNIIVVGGGVDQGELNTNNIKRVLKDWVDAGGTVLNLGGDGTQSWTNPLWRIRQNGATDPPVDVSDHPILNTPNQLNVDGFAPPLSTWNFNLGAESNYAQVAVVAGTTGGDTQSLLAIGKPGQFGKGRVHITAWMPGALTEESTSCATLSADTQCQGLFLIHNMLSLSYERLYIEFGPEPPETAETSSILRLATVYHPSLGKDLNMAVQVFVFRQGG